MIRIDDRNIAIQGRLLRVARLDLEKYHFLENPEALLAALRQRPERIDMFTFLQRLPETSPQYPYPMEWDNLAVLPISTFDHWWTKQIGFKARNKAKQAGKSGVEIREVPFDAALARGIWQVYNESPVRQGRPNTHYGKDLATVYEQEATYLESSLFIGAYFDGDLIGFIKLVWDEARTQAGLMNIVSMVRHRDKAPTNALVAQAVRSCAERGISRLVYENFAYGRKERSSLSDFKERNAFKRVDLPRYYIPLTRLGSLALTFGLHHRFVDRIPESVAGMLRELRSFWYQRRFGVATE